MKHIVVDLETNNIRQKSEARKICTMETIEIGAVMLDDEASDEDDEEDDWRMSHEN